MAFYCRGDTITNNAFSGYRYIESRVVALGNGLPDPITFSDAQAVCAHNTNFPTAIDAQILYSDGASPDSLKTLFDQYFALDPTMFELVFGSFMLAFVSGHVLGRVISGLRKAG